MFGIISSSQFNTQSLRVGRAILVEPKNTENYSALILEVTKDSIVISTISTADNTQAHADIRVISKSCMESGLVRIHPLDVPKNCLDNFGFTKTNIFNTEVLKPNTAISIKRIKGDGTFCASIALVRSCTENYLSTVCISPNEQPITEHFEVDELYTISIGPVYTAEPITASEEAKC